MNSKIKILYLLPTLNVGGAERVTMNIIRKLDKNRFDIYLVLISKRGALLNLIPSYVNVIDLKGEKTSLSFFKLKNILKIVNPDIIYSTLLRTHILLYLVLRFYKKDVKLILRSPTSPKILIDRGELNIFIKFMLDRAYASSDQILAQTPEMREEINYYHNIDINKILVFINPIDDKLIDKKIENSINPFNKDMINIVTAGTIYEVKGFDTLLYAFKLVLEKNDNFFLHIIGRDGGERNNLINLAKELGVFNRVKFWGFQDNPYMFFYYSDLYVLSSRREGLPNTILENLYLGKKVVATKCISYMDKLIDNGINGYLVEVDDAVELSNAILSYRELNIKEISHSIDDDVDDYKKINSLFLNIYDMNSISL